MSIKLKLLAVSALAATTGWTWGQQPPATGVEARGAPQAPNGAARAGRGGGGFVSAPTFDKEPPVLTDNLKPGGVLIFSKTIGFRDDASIQASNAALAAIAHERGWPFFITESGAVMNKDQLEKFKVVVWNNTSGDTLTARTAKAANGAPAKQKVAKADASNLGRRRLGGCRRQRDGLQFLDRHPDARGGLGAVSDATQCLGSANAECRQGRRLEVRVRQLRFLQMRNCRKLVSECKALRMRPNSSSRCSCSAPRSCRKVAWGRTS